MLGFAFGKSLIHPVSEKGIVVPILGAGDDEQFWLFFCNIKLDKVLKSGMNKPLPGYWLNVLDGTTTDYVLSSQ